MVAVQSQDVLMELYHQTLAFISSPISFFGIDGLYNLPKVCICWNQWWLAVAGVLHMIFLFGDEQ